jgi:hypothetical protein
MSFNYDIHIFQIRMYDIVMYITWLLYFAIALGISVNAPEYLITLQSFLKIYISLFLIYRFNPFREVKFTELDAKIAFSSGVFLLGTTAIDVIIKNYISTFKEYIKIFKFNY